MRELSWKGKMESSGKVSKSSRRSIDILELHHHHHNYGTERFDVPYGSF
jgi:hypothetical protein